MFLLYFLCKVIRIVIIRVMLDYLQILVGTIYVSPNRTMFLGAFFHAKAAEQRSAQSVMLVN